MRFARSLTLSGEEKSIDVIWSWYEDQQEALRKLKNEVLDALRNLRLAPNSKFITYSLDEINEYFEENFEELEHLVSFDLIAATEGRLRSNFFKTVFNKERTDIGRAFREIHRAKGNHISLEEDILEKWKEHDHPHRSAFSDFKGILHYRHWLAHGRYWKLLYGRMYSADETYQIADNIFRIIPET